MSRLVVLGLSPRLAAAIPALAGPAWSPGRSWCSFSGGAGLIRTGALTVGLSTLVSTGAGADEQGTAFGVAPRVGSLDRTLGPPLAAVPSVTASWSPFLAGALVALPVPGVRRYRT